MKKILSEINCNLPSMKTTFCVALLLGTVLTAPVVVLNAHAQGPPSGAPPSFTALADRWTKWILSIDTSTDTNPFTHTYTADCSQLIQGNTMFLVGQTGTGGTVDHGTCIVPSKTSIFYPLINYVTADCTINTHTTNPPKQAVCSSSGIQTPAHGQPFAEWRQAPNEFTDTASSLQSTLDGKPIDFARIQSPPGGFGVIVTANNALFGDLTSFFEGTVPLHAVVDGYWSLLSKPLPTGEHTLTFGGCAIDPTSNSKICQTNSYTLEVQ